MDLILPGSRKTPNPSHTLTMEDGKALKIRAILATDREGVIGYDNDLIFNNPADLKNFKSLTMGHTIVMGWKTFQSMHDRILPGRQSVIMSKSNHRKSREEYISTLHPPAATPMPIVISDINELPAIAATRNDPAVYIIGGASIYDLFQKCTMTWIVTKYRINVIKDGVAAGLIPEHFNKRKIVSVSFIKKMGRYSCGMIDHGMFISPNGTNINYVIESYRSFVIPTPVTPNNLLLDEELHINPPGIKRI